MSATNLAKKYKQQVLKQQQLQLQAVLDEFADAINKTSSTSEKRPLSLRVSEAKACKKRKVSPDATKVSGLNGTLGSNLVKLSDELPSKTMRERYFSILSRNGIIDISDDKDGSQLHALDGGSNTKKNIVGKVENASPPKKIEDCDDYLHADDKRLLKNV
ncbi:hypothetical protein BDB00DRAFT_286023 [Zychaea mexicana]|uniref:uncharacterized protein n=1 Tax=Zychaea mexicana TaxID=64656 RepID=UPI0022FE3C8E|nr:uncharacterized protein BDB00DRAFT_286023 [Zychaea mexicana]KAI9467997.1 hypothetical protein BDB00DRAFT_286023 [Zychaea mexicana]